MSIGVKEITERGAMDIYHGEANGASARLLITIEEKGLKVRGHLVDLLAASATSSHIGPDGLTASLPMIVIEGEALSGESFVCEYLEEAFAGMQLLPATPYERWQARAWCKLVDDGFGASVSDLAYVTLPSPDGVIGTLPDERIDAARERIRALIAKAEPQLEANEWLAGNRYSLADIAVFAYANYLPQVAADLIDPALFPNVHLWLGRVANRPAVRAALARGRSAEPYAISTVGPGYIRWG